MGVGAGMGGRMETAPWTFAGVTAANAAAHHACSSKADVIALNRFSTSPA
jgi:hypothetical protein